MLSASVIGGTGLRSPHTVGVARVAQLLQPALCLLTRFVWTVVVILLAGCHPGGLVGAPVAVGAAWAGLYAR